jgi:hypothetical protein
MQDSSSITNISPGTGFATDITTLLNAVLSFIMVIAALLVFFYLIWGGINWITSGGDKGKTEAARNKIVAAVIGILIIASSYAVTLLVLNFLGFKSFADLFQNLRTINSGRSTYTRASFANNDFTAYCGAGFEGNYTLCNKGCDLSSGICKSNNPYVVKFVCDGKQIKCDQNMSTANTEQNISGISCGKTVQIDIFDKPCVNSDGSWSCTDRNIVDFMTWYSGDC